MRLSLSIIVFLTTAGCAATTERPVRPACDLRSTCFNQRNVRDFEMLDDRTMLVEVGGARCPYLVELDGFQCNVRFSTRVAFQDADGRICALDNTYVVTGPFANDFNDLCRVRDVRAISDDELLERYATLGRIAPLPPVGSGELQVEEATDAEGASESGDDSANN